MAAFSVRRVGDIYREPQEPLRLRSGAAEVTVCRHRLFPAVAVAPATLPVAPCDGNQRGQPLKGWILERSGRTLHIQVNDASACCDANAPRTPQSNCFPAPGPRLRGPGSRLRIRGLTLAPAGSPSEGSPEPTASSRGLRPLAAVPQLARWTNGNNELVPPLRVARSQLPSLRSHSSYPTILVLQSRSQSLSRVLISLAVSRLCLGSPHPQPSKIVRIT